MKRTAHHKITRLVPASAAPAGVTLTEVLMSLMIMSIGISAVAVLFPISMLRSLQATQLTNAAVLKVNAEALVQMRPTIVFDPDGDGNLDEHIGRLVERRYIVDPSGYYSLTNLGATYITDPRDPGNQAATRGFADWVGNTDNNADGVPEIFMGLPRYDAGIRTATRSAAYPLGLRPDANAFPEEARALDLLASTMSKLGDGWLTQVDTMAEAFVLANGSTSTAPAPTDTIVGVVLSPDLDLTIVPDGNSNAPRVSGTQIIPDPELYRVVVFSADGRISQSLPITRINAGPNIVLWTEDLNLDGSFNAATEDLNLNGSADQRALPLEFVDRNLATPVFQAGRILLQSNRTHDYNWMLTVRRGGDGQARGVDVVVTFNKSVTPDEERLYTADFLRPLAGVRTGFQVFVLQDGGFRTGTTVQAEPFLKRGGFVLDVLNARWYRIRDYAESDTVTVNGNTAKGYIITLETPVIENAVGGKAMFLPGVVDVFPMGSMSFPDSD